MSAPDGTAGPGPAPRAKTVHTPGHAPAHGPHAHEHGAAFGAGCGGHGPAPFDASALVSARGVGIRRGGRVLIENIDLDIRPGEIVTLIGPNGAGKSTLVRTVLGLERLDAGEVRRRADLRVGYVPQRFDIDPALPMTVRRFLSLGTGADERRALAALSEAGAGHVADRQLPEISGGELQRVLLARALLANPTLLVLDEPVQGVDYQGEAELYTLIGTLRDERGFGVLLVSHDLHVVMAASDRVICLNRHVCCSGVPETVAQHPEYARLFGPESARAFGLYHHHHDHRHDLSGGTAPAEERRGG